MNPFDYIRNWFITARDIFIQLAINSYSEFYIPDTFGDWFNNLSTFCHNIAVRLFDVARWYDDVTAKIVNVLSLDQILAYFQTWISYATDAWSWVVNAWSNVTSIIDNWWSSAQYTVLAWIEEAKQWALTQIATLEDTVSYVIAWWNEFYPKIPTIDEILAWFSDWWAKILAPLTSWWNEKLLEVRSLIESEIRDWLPFYDELTTLWGDIKLFFADPLQWAYDKLDEWFERFW